jgi:hypothetical protein
MTKFRFEVSFKKFHPKMNLTTFFKSTLRNTIKQFLGHKKLKTVLEAKKAKLKKPFTEDTLRIPNVKIHARHLGFNY